MRLTRNADDAEELVAETIAKAWAKFAELRDAQCFEAWIWQHARDAGLVDSHVKRKDDRGQAAHPL